MSVEVTVTPYKYTPEQIEKASESENRLGDLWDRGPKKSFFFKKQTQSTEDWMKEIDTLETKLISEVVSGNNQPTFLDDIWFSTGAIGDKIVLSELERIFNDETLSILTPYLDGEDIYKVDKKYYTKENAKIFISMVERQLGMGQSKPLKDFINKVKDFISDPQIKAIHLSYG